MHQRRGMWPFAVTAAAVALAAGCSGNPDGTAESAEWSPPAWFAKQAQDLEELRVLLQPCMDDKGWSVTIDKGGGIVESIPMDQMDAISADMDECLDSAGYDTNPSEPTREDFNSWYQANLDTRDCLIAHGYEVSEPPSQDAWVDGLMAATARAETTGEMASSPPWGPYGDWLYRLTPAEQTALTETCPEMTGYLEKKAP